MQVDLVQCLPQDIGMAAAYEAYRMWKYNRSALFDPLQSVGGSGATERVREALVGLAIAEGILSAFIADQDADPDSCAHLIYSKPPLAIYQSSHGHLWSS